MPTVIIDSSKCTGEGICVSVCPTSTFEMQGDKAVVTKPQDCILCMACVAQCPTQAITVKED